MPEILLILTLIMPPDKRDQSIQIPEKSIEQCFADAKEFISRGVSAPMRAAGGVGIMAGCASHAKSDDL